MSLVPLIDKRLESVAKRGYGWYLALKVLQALAAPVMLALLTAWLLILAPLALLIEWGKSAWALLLECIGYYAEFFGRRWLSGFSRAYYHSLRKYQPQAATLDDDA
jgi:hypothetical protein